MKKLLLVPFIALTPLFANAHEHKDTNKDSKCDKNDIIVSDAVIAAPLKGKSSTAAYMTIRNKCAHHIDLKVIKTDLDAIAELHDMKMVDGNMKMEKVDSIPVKKHSTLHLKKGGKHVMIMDIKKELNPYDKVGLTLIFDHDIEVPTEAVVKEMKKSKKHF